MQPTTSLSLLARACGPSHDESWNRLVEIYAPLLSDWLRKYDVQPADADDLVQEVLNVVVKELSQFQHNQQPGAFRKWLRQVLVHRLHNHWRERDYRPPATGRTSVLEQLNQLEDDSSQLSRLWDEEHDRHVMARLLEVVRPRFQEKTWEAFRRQMFDGHKPDAVAAALGMPISSVYVARSRVLAALRQEAAGLLDSA